jgi:hypothetical protein
MTTRLIRKRLLSKRTPLFYKTKNGVSILLSYAIDWRRYIKSIMEDAATNYVFLFDVLEGHSKGTASQAFFNGNPIHGYLW